MTPKIAIVHDFYIRRGGAERVLEHMHALWPDAPIYCLVADRHLVRKHLPSATVRLWPVGRLWGASHWYPLAAWAMPAAVESWDFSAFDIVISNSVAFAGGVVVRPGTHHLCYCYSPMRALWDRHAAYERRGIASGLIRHGLRLWDQAAAHRADTIVAISQTVADRIATYWHRDAMVVPPPTPAPLVPSPSRPYQHGYLLAVGRLVPHKRFDVLIDAANKMGEHLIIVGDGPLRDALAQRAGPTVQLVGALPDQALATLYAHASAVVVANEEDWGLVAIEAMQQGTPVLALRKGGATETVLEGITGEFFDDAIPAAIADGIKRIKTARSSYDPVAIRAHAAQYSDQKWATRMHTLINSLS